MQYTHTIARPLRSPYTGHNAVSDWLSVVSDDEIRDMRIWCYDNVYIARSREDVFSLCERRIIETIRVRYKGGISAFLRSYGPARTYGFKVRMIVGAGMVDRTVHQTYAQAVNWAHDNLRPDSLYEIVVVV